MNVFSNSISGSIFVCIFNSISCCIFRDTATVPSRLLRICRRRRTVSAPSPRGRYGKFLAAARGSASAGRLPYSIRSGLHD